MIALMLKEIGTIMIPDVVDLEIVDASNNVTDWPVEEGGIKTDHISLKAITIKITCRQSTIRVSRSGYETDISRPAKAQDALIKARDDRSIFEINTGTRKFKNMAITSLLPKKDRNEPNVILFEISFKQINYATVKTVDVLVQNPSQDPNANVSPDTKSSGNGGSSETKATRSTLSNILN